MANRTCHNCRAKRISESLFCCIDCWFKLPQHVRNLVSKTAHLPMLSFERRKAIEAARDAWKKLL